MEREEILAIYEPGAEGLLRDSGEIQRVDG